jgi:hypothetical protein
MTQLKLRLPAASLLILAILSSLVMANLTGCKSQPSDSWEGTFSVTVKDVTTRKPIVGAEVKYVSVANTANADSMSLSGITDVEGKATLMDYNVDVDTLRFIFINCIKTRYEVFTGAYDSTITRASPSASVLIHLKRI